VNILLKRNVFLSACCLQYCYKKEGCYSVWNTEFPHLLFVTVYSSLVSLHLLGRIDGNPEKPGS
jgi:hypothetical protein